MERCCNCNREAVKRFAIEPEFGEIYVCDNVKCSDRVKRDIGHFSDKITTENNNKMKRFYRKNGMIGGVCAGLAEYINIDVLFIRLAFFFIPGSIGPYFLLWLFGPHENNINK
jgi:phage shock protein PspC (stress-responsive transcriptional regulator)